MAHGAGTIHGAGHAGTGGRQGPAAAGEHTAGHPTEWQYIKIAAILAAITIVEVAIYYIDWVHDNGVLVPALLAMSAVKFSFVVGYFMHLKFDDKRLLWIFLAGLIVAFSIIMALYALFSFSGIDYAQRLF